MNYIVRMDGVEEKFSATSEQEAREYAEEWIREGDWDTSSGETFWVHGHLFTLSDDGSEEDSERITVRIDPEVPECTETEHDWQSPHDIVGGLVENPGVWGHGGGVIINEVCLNCGCKRVTDTWAQDMVTGEQGLEAVKYEPNFIQEVSDERVAV